MPVSESRRLHLFESAQASLGHDAAEALMDLLPTDPEQLATKADLRELRLATQADFAELRADFAELRSETRMEIGGLRVELHRALAEQTRTLILAMIGFVLTATALAFAAVRLAR